MIGTFIMCLEDNMYYTLVSKIIRSITLSHDSNYAHRKKGFLNVYKIWGSM